MGGWWLKYSVLLSLIKLAIEGNVTKITEWTRNDTWSLVSSGVCKFLDVLHTPDGTFGTSAMWFLYCGAVAFVVMYIVGKYLFMRSVIIVSLATIVVLWVLNYFSETPVLSRVAYQALPFLYLGLLIHHHEVVSVKSLIEKSSLLLAVTIIMSVTLYIEYIFNPVLEEIYLSTPLLTITLFLLCLKFPNIIIKPFDRLPVKITMDIYIWHRLIYALVTIYIYDFSKISGIVVFMICILLFSTYRYLDSKIRLK